MTLLVLLCSGGIMAQAPQPPDPAEEALRRQQRERIEREQRETLPDVRLPTTQQPFAERFPEGETPCFHIERIVLDGEDAAHFDFALHILDADTQDPRGRCLGTQGINAVLAQVQNAIIARGYVTTRVLAAAQDLNDGQLTLTIVPGRIRSIRLEGDPAARAALHAAVPARAGQLLNLRDFEQALENLRRSAGNRVDIRLEAAAGDDAQPGQSDVVIHLQRSFPLRVSITVDDGGARSTGRYQGNLGIAWENPLLLGDLLHLGLNEDLGGGERGRRGSRGSAIHYSVPLGYWLLGLSASEYRYHQEVAGINQSYLYRGLGSSADLRLARTVYRDAVRKSTLSLRLYTRGARNFIEDAEILVQRRRTAGWEAEIAHREHLGRTVLDLSLTYRHGTAAFGTLKAAEEASGNGATRPRLWRADASLQLPFALGAQPLRYSTQWRAQWQRTPLVPQDRFSIGGRHTVRGFDGEQTLSADRGWLWRNELALAFGAGAHEAYVALDHGRVGGPSARWLAGTRLSGGAIGIRGGLGAVRYDIFAGRPLSRPPGLKTAASTTGFSLALAF